MNILVYLLIILALLAPPKHYHYQGLHVLSGDLDTCGAARRLLREHWDITIGIDTATVNRVKWDIKAHADNEYVLEHKADTEAYMSMTMEVTPSLAWVTLQGITETRKFCRDTVVLVRVQ